MNKTQPCQQQYCRAQVNAGEAYYSALCTILIKNLVQNGTWTPLRGRLYMYMYSMGVLSLQYITFAVPYVAKHMAQKDVAFLYKQKQLEAHRAKSIVLWILPWTA